MAKAKKKPKDEIVGIYFKVTESERDKVVANMMKAQVKGKPDYASYFLRAVGIRK